MPRLRSWIYFGMAFYIEVAPDGAGLAGGTKQAAKFCGRNNFKSAGQKLKNNQNFQNHETGFAVMKCPHCHSANTKRKPMVYVSEKYRETSYGKRSGITFGQSGLGDAASPPTNIFMALLGFWSIPCFFIWFNYGTGAFLGSFWGGALLLGIIYWLLGGFKKDNEKHANWANSWRCLDCGASWDIKKVD